MVLSAKKRRSRSRSRSNKSVSKRSIVGGKSRRSSKSKRGKRVSCKKLKPTEGCCMKCGKKRVMTKTKLVTTKNKRKMIKGICGLCGTKMAKFVKSD